jgi:hypothetical protein
MDVQQSVEAIAGQQAAEKGKAPRAFDGVAAWLYWVLTVGLIIVRLFLKHLNSPPTFLSDVFNALVLSAFATIGALIALRQRANLIGWVICIGTLLWAAGELALEYGAYGLLTVPGSLPVPQWMVLLGAWIQAIGFSLVLFFVLLLFPDGHLPSPRWRKVVWFIVATNVLFSVFLLFSPKLFYFRFSSFDNPLGVIMPEPVFSIFLVLVLLCWVVSILACVAAIVLRFRSAQGEERQQLKWLTYSSFLSLLVAPAGAILVTQAVLNVNTSYETGAFLFTASLAPILIAVGIAILRYRLYDIDLIINRTLVYVPLTGIVAGLYSASVALFQKLFQAITGEGSDAAIVISTLILASLFTPIKNGLQSLVDRRFKEAPDRTKKLKAFDEEVQSVEQVIDRMQITARLLDEAIAAFGAEAGAIYLSQGGEMRPAHASEKWSGESQLSLPLQSDGKRIGSLKLSARLDGLDYSQEDLQLLQQVADRVAHVILLQSETRQPSELAGVTR